MDDLLLQLIPWKPLTKNHLRSSFSQWFVCSLSFVSWRKSNKTWKSNTRWTFGNKIVLWILCRVWIKSQLLVNQENFTVGLTLNFQQSSCRILCKIWRLTTVHWSRHLLILLYSFSFKNLKYFILILSWVDASYLIDVIYQMKKKGFL